MSYTIALIGREGAFFRSRSLIGFRFIMAVVHVRHDLHKSSRQLFPKRIADSWKRININVAPVAKVML